MMISHILIEEKISCLYKLLKKSLIKIETINYMEHFIYFIIFLRIQFMNSIIDKRAVNITYYRNASQSIPAVLTRM